jgi:uncharacterized protein
MLSSVDAAPARGLVWIDLDNSPHVPFFRPIIAALRERGHPVRVTARDAYNVHELLALHQLDARLVGRHHGRHKAAKVLGLGVRATQLLPQTLAPRPVLAVSHGSRAQVLAARLMRIPSLVIADYEHVVHPVRPDWLLAPDVIPRDTTQRIGRCSLGYPGIKEDVYAAGFVPDPALRAQLGIGEAEILAVVRPPATEAHYHHRDSDALFEEALVTLFGDPRVRVVLLPRNAAQRAAVEARHATARAAGRLIVPDAAVDGLNLVWCADLVVSGGGTMNREAAALGVPVYSSFRGTLGAVDRYLAAQRRLVLLESVGEVRHKLQLVQRERPAAPVAVSRRALDTIVAHIAELATRTGGAMAAVQEGR